VTFQCKNLTVSFLSWASWARKEVAAIEKGKLFLIKEEGMAQRFRIRRYQITVAVLLIGVNYIASAAEGFPGRAKYKEVPYIELGDLFAVKDRVVIVDVRSKFEYETLRIKGAVNIPVANKSFEAHVLDLRQSTEKRIVFYCNGHRCLKSYQAVKKAGDVGVDNTVAYDGGIFDWTMAYPNNAVLLGHSPVDTSKLIGIKSYQARLLNPDLFSESIVRLRNEAIVLDVRDKYQRAGVGFYPGLEKWASLDNKKKLNRYIGMAKRENKTLFIYDEVGSQVRWLQYALEKAGIKKYYFMEKGARAYYEMLAHLEWH
jgi:rhodanese-related sulfurtransferase